MRKFFIPSLTAVLLLGLLVAPVGAKGPKCADILGTAADGSQDSRAAFDPDLDQAFGQFFLEANSCSSITYTLFILDDETDTTPLSSGSVQGTGATDFVNIEVGGLENVTDNDVCAYVTTSRGKNVFDRGPAEGCVLLIGGDQSPGGGKGF